MTPVIIRRRLVKPKGRGGRPRKPEGHAHVAIAHARLTAPERLALDRVREKRRTTHLVGGENDSDWIREMLHREVVALGIEVPAGYVEARLVRAINVEGLRKPVRVADEPPEEIEPRDARRRGGAPARNGGARGRDMKEVLQELKSQGWTLNPTNRNHIEAVPPDPGKSIVHLTTNGGYRNLPNSIRDLRRSGFVWPPKRTKASREEAPPVTVEPSSFSPPAPRGAP